MELFRIAGVEKTYHPESYRIGWIAFDPENPLKRVLFDSHPPKGLHFHLDDDKQGKPFAWNSLSKTEEVFFEMVCLHFNIDEKELL